jgi:hypothetical protein
VPQEERRESEDHRRTQPGKGLDHQPVKGADLAPKPPKILARRVANRLEFGPHPSEPPSTFFSSLSTFASIAAMC